MRLPSADAKAAGGEASDCDICGGQAGGGAEALPVLPHEGAGDGDGAVVLDERVEAHDAGEQVEEAIGNDVAGEIVDEPAGHGGVLHPLDKADDIGVGEVVGEKRTHDEMRGLRWRVGEDVAGDPADAARDRADFRSNGGGIRIEVEAGELHGDSPGFRPTFDGAQGVAVAAAYVEDANDVRVLAQIQAFNPLQGGAIAEEGAVEPCDVAEAGSEIGAGAGLVHQFRKVGRLGAAGEIKGGCASGDGWNDGVNGQGSLAGSETVKF
jgi:hypothetical protein